MRDLVNKVMGRPSGSVKGGKILDELTGFSR